MFKKLRRAKAAAARLPRGLKELQDLNNEMLTKLAQHQYQKYILEVEISRLNQELMSVNNEGAARLKLDQEAAEKAKSEEKLESKAEEQK